MITLLQTNLALKETILLTLFIVIGILAVLGLIFSTYKLLEYIAGKDLDPRLIHILLVLYILLGLTGLYFYL